MFRSVAVLNLTNKRREDPQHSESLQSFSVYVPVPHMRRRGLPLSAASINASAVRCCSCSHYRSNQSNKEMWLYLTLNSRLTKEDEACGSLYWCAAFRVHAKTFVKLPTHMNLSPLFCRLFFSSLSFWMWSGFFCQRDETAERPALQPSDWLWLCLQALLRAVKTLPTPKEIRCLESIFS